VRVIILMNIAIYLTPLGDRKYGWSPLGITLTISQSLKRLKRWSILPAFTIDGYIEWVIYQGSITAAIFNDFVRQQVIPHTTPFAGGGPRSVIICDNASIHWNTELEEICT